MRCFAGDLRPYDHLRDAALPRKLFRPQNELPADPCAPKTIGDHQAADLAVGLSLQVVNNADVDPPHYRVRRTSDVNGVIG